MTEGPLGDPNPFAAPSADVPSPPRRFDWRPPAFFLIRTALVLLVLPTLFSALAGLLGFRWWWAFAPVAWFFLGPVAVLQINDRFLAPVRDPTPVVFASGLVMDRWRFRRLVRTVLVERITLVVLIVAVTVPLLGRIAVAVVPFLVLFAAWTLWFSFQNLRISDSLVAMVEEDYPRVAESAGKVLAWPILNRYLVPVAALHVGVARLRMGEADAALAALEKVPRWALPQAHLTRAWILAAMGRLDDAKRAMQGRQASNLGERMAREYALAAIALEEGRPQAVVDQAKGWSDLRDGQPQSIREGFDLAEAGALALVGRAADARALLVRTGAGRESRPWLERTWPRLWTALADLDREGPGVGSAP